MNHRLKSVVRDYLSFSARERNGIIILVVAAALGFVIFRYYPIKKTVIPKDAFQQELAQLKISVDSSNYNRNYQRDDNSADYYQPKSYERNGGIEGELFAFDPNTLSVEGWKRLGLRDKTIQTIQNFLAKGYKFRHAEDIAKIYGLKPQDAQRLMPYVTIAGAESDNSAAGYTARPFTENKENFTKAPRTFEINTADSSAFIALPGIGSKLASRIINFRQRLGGFSSVAQVAETYGLPDSTFQVIKQRLECNSSAVKKININTAEASELKTHPYIKWNIANAIVNYRMQHGNYTSIDELRKIDIITDDLFNKIAPYLVI